MKVQIIVERKLFSKLINNVYKHIRFNSSIFCYKIYEYNKLKKQKNSYLILKS